MGEFPVDDAQLITYLVLTFASIVVSVVVYCMYYHVFCFGDGDYLEHITILADIS